MSGLVSDLLVSAIDWRDHRTCNPLWNVLAYPTGYAFNIWFKQCLPMFAQLYLYWQWAFRFDGAGLKPAEWEVVKAFIEHWEPAARGYLKLVTDKVDEDGLVPEWMIALSDARYAPQINKGCLSTPPADNGERAPHYGARLL